MKFEKAEAIFKADGTAPDSRTERRKKWLPWLPISILSPSLDLRDGSRSSFSLLVFGSHPILYARKTCSILILIQAFSILVRGFVHVDLSIEAVHAFRRIDDYGCAPDCIAFSATIVILYKKMHAIEVQEFFDSLKDRFAPRDVVVYTSLVHG
ncbi:hypothetical protein ACLOJK_008718 [Asimina triloba]